VLAIRVASKNGSVQKIEKNSKRKIGGYEDCKVKDVVPIFNFYNNTPMKAGSVDVTQKIALGKFWNFLYHSPSK